MTGRDVRVRWAASAGLLAMLAGCTATTDEPSPSASATASVLGDAGGAAPLVEPAPSAEPDPWTSVVATAVADAVEVFASPGADISERTLSADEVVSLPDQVPLTFLVAHERGDWLQVVLPVAPNGTTGWLRAEDVALTATDDRVEVRLTDRRLLLHRAGEVVLDVPLGVGGDAVPAPGTYFLTELLRPPIPQGVYGAYVYGLSGHPPVLEAFAAGQAVVGIHGTARPETLGTEGTGGTGTAAGSLVLSDADVTRLVEEFGLPLGTPVEIVG